MKDNEEIIIAVGPLDGVDGDVNAVLAAATPKRIWIKTDFEPKILRIKQHPQLGTILYVEKVVQ